MQNGGWNASCDGNKRLIQQADNKQTINYSPLGCSADAWCLPRPPFSSCFSPRSLRSFFVAHNAHFHDTQHRLDLADDTLLRHSRKTRLNNRVRINRRNITDRDAFHGTFASNSFELLRPICLPRAFSQIRTILLHDSQHSKIRLDVCRRFYDTRGDVIRELTARNDESRHISRHSRIYATFSTFHGTTRHVGHLVTLQCDIIARA